MAQVTQHSDGPVGTDEHGDAPRRRSSTRTWATVAVLLVVGALAAFLVLRDPGPPTLTQRQVDVRVSLGLKERAEEEARAPANATVAFAAIRPSLVLITTTGATSEGRQGGSGAGTIINEVGTVLTALHVVEGAETITVAYTDGTSSPATIGATDPGHDIATLVPEHGPETIVPAVLGGGVQVGATVFAVGHPFGLAGSLSAGVVSALDRQVTVADGKRLEGLIQIDAAVNPGNSGGPLLNTAGQVVGVVTGLANPNDDGFFVGIGFAVPIATAGGTAGGPPR